MHPVLVKIGQVSVYSWGFMLAIAVLVAIVGLSRKFTREGLDKEIVLDMVIVMVLAGVLGGRIAYIVVYEWSNFLAQPLIFFDFPSGGLMWYGSFIGGFLAFAVYIGKKGLSFWRMADIFAPYLALGYAIVRLGCFLNGCCFGKVTNSSWGVIFPYVDHLTRWPTQLFSSATNLLLFAFLMWFYPHRKFPGQVFLLYLIAYSIYRFVIEFYRFNVYYLGIFSYIQIFTAGLFGVALAVYVWQQLRYKKA